MEITECVALNNDTIAFENGDAVGFINVTNGQVDFHNIFNEREVDLPINGITCIGSNQSESVFALGCISTVPCISLFSFPDVRCIAQLKDESTAGYYQQIEFTEGELLIAFTLNDNYQIEVWDWRNKSKLLIQKTDFFIAHQTIKCSYTYPVMVAQMALHSSRLNIWEIYSSIDLTMAIKTEIVVQLEGQIYNLIMCFDIEGSLYLLQSDGSVWLMIPKSRHKEKVTSIESRDDRQLLMTPFKGGIVLIDANNMIQFLKRSESGKWEMQWNIVSSDMTKTYLLNFDDNILILASKGKIIEIIVGGKSTMELALVTHSLRTVKKCVFLHPNADHLVMQINQNEIILVEIPSCVQIARQQFNDLCTIESHPNEPILAVSTCYGRVLILKFNDSGICECKSEYFLTDCSVPIIQFFPNSNLLIAIDEENDLFLIQYDCDESNSIKYFIRHLNDFIDVTTLRIRNLIWILNLCTSNLDDRPISFGLCTIIDMAMGNLRHKTMSISLNEHYSAVKFQSNDSNPLVLAARMCSGAIDIFDVRMNDSGESEITIIRSVAAHHSKGVIHFCENISQFISYGTDGRVVFWDFNTMEVTQSEIVHSKYSGGVIYATYSDSSNLLVTIGQNGNHICHRKNLDSFEFLWMNISCTNDEIIGKEIFTTNIPIPLSGHSKSWKHTELMRIRKEQLDHFKPLFESVQEELAHIKNTVKRHMDASGMKANGMEANHFPIQFYNIDVDKVEHQKEENKKNLESERKKLENEFLMTKKRIAQIQENLFVRFKYSRIRIREIFSDLFIENYPLTQLDRNISGDDTMEILSANPELFQCIYNLEPWIRCNVIKNDDELKWLKSSADVCSEGIKRFTAAISKKINLQLSTQINWPNDFTSGLINMDEEIHDVSNENKVKIHNMKIYENVIKLKEIFNKMFDHMRKIKETEMNSLQKLNKRVEIIQQDVNLLESLNDNEQHTKFDPLPCFDYSDDEKYWSAFKVEELISQLTNSSVEYEKSAPIAATPNEENPSSVQRASMGMMNEILDVYCEDEIKKDIPKPPCLLADKNPDEYIDYEKEKILRYQEKLKKEHIDGNELIMKLMSERNELITSKDDQIQKLNKCIDNLMKSKVHAHFAICTRELEILLCMRDHQKYIGMCDKEQKILNQKNEMKTEINVLTKLVQSLEQNVNTLKTKLDESTAKDQSIDRQFRTVFAELVSPAIFDQAYRIFKRRPKSHLTTCQSSIMLEAMIKRLKDASNETILSEECKQYLNWLEAAEKYSNAPGSLDPSIWNHLCRIKRSKIQIEFNIRCNAALLSAAEITLTVNSKHLATKRSMFAQFESKLIEMREEKEKWLKHRKIQIFFKHGNIQIQLTGNRNDFNGTMLLKVDLAKTNVAIQETAERKIKVEQSAESYRRRVDHYKWKQSMLQMTIDDLRIYSNRIEKCAITKHLKMWLAGKTKQNPQNRDFGDTNEKNSKSAILKRIKQLDLLIDRERKHNMELDHQIATLKVNINDVQFNKHYAIHEKDIIARNERMVIISKRSKLMAKIQQQHSELLELSATLELQQLRTYPTLNNSMAN